MRAQHAHHIPQHLALPAHIPSHSRARPDVNARVTCVQGQDGGVRQDCLDGVLAVAARFGEQVPTRPALCDALLAEIDASSGPLLKKALACLRARSHVSLALLCVHVELPGPALAESNVASGLCAF